MGSKKFNNQNENVKVIEEGFKSIYDALRNFKRLSEQEAIVYIEIMKKKNVTVQELAEILKEKAIKTTTTKPYAIIKNLTDADLLFVKKKNSRNKVYHPIHPRDLTIDIKESIKKLDDELAFIESQEVKVFEEIIENSEKFDSEYEITDDVNNLRKNRYDILFYFNPITVNRTHMLYKRLTKNFSLKAIEGKFSALFAENKGEKIFPKVAILLVKNHRLDDKNDIVGIKIVDPEVFSCLRKGVLEK